MGALIYLDTETTGLNPDVHDIWEIAYAVDGGPILSEIVAHELCDADPKALEIGRYYERSGGRTGDAASLAFEDALYDTLHGATIVGANPAFDTAFLRGRWGEAPWHHRLLDIEAYAMGAIGAARPQGLATIAAELVRRGIEIPTPDHTAGGDVATTRACHLALIDLYRKMGG